MSEGWDHFFGGIGGFISVIDLKEADGPMWQHVATPEMVLIILSGPPDDAGRGEETCQLSFFCGLPKEGIPQHAREHRWEQLHVGWQSGGGALLSKTLNRRN